MRMTFKRGFIGGMLTISAFVGLYFSFFNHPPAAETLKANTHRHNGEKLSPPKFLDFGPPKSNQANGPSRHILFENDDAGKRTKDKTPRDHGTDHADAAASKALSSVKDLHGNGSQKTDLAIVDLTNLDPTDAKKDKDEPDLPNSVNSTVAPQKTDGAGDDVRNEGKKGAKADEENVVTSIPEGDSGPTFTHRTFPRFDWDKWVTDNDLVDVGTIWGYCDEPEPPVIGKVLLMKDEDGSGLKVVVTMNTTFDESIEFGSIFVSVMYGGMSFYEKTLDICTLYDDSEPEPGEEIDTFFNCPMAAGNKFYTKELHVPFFVPSGHFTAKAKLIDQKERSIICTSADLSL